MFNTYVDLVFEVTNNYNQQVLYGTATRQRRYFRMLILRVPTNHTAHQVGNVPILY